MFLQYELVVLVAMIGTLLLLNMAFKLPTSVSMVAAAIVGALVAGQGIPLRHLFEGEFAFLDTAIIISTAMIFMFVVQASGTFEAIGAGLVKGFYKRPVLLLFLIMLVIIFPGMITGTASISVLCAGAIVAPILQMMGFDKVMTATFIAVGATLGMAAPPVNIPAMMIASSVDMSYSGFNGPLLVIVFASAIIYTMIVGIGKVHAIDMDEAKEKMNFEIGKTYGFKLYIPIIFVVGVILAVRIFPQHIPDPGMPLVFVLGSIIAVFTGRKLKLLEVASDAMRENVSVLGKVMAIGMFLQIFVLTGARGYVVANCFSLPVALLFVVSVILIPLFGGVSVYGSASLFGPPLLLAMLSGDEIVIAAALSVLAIVGEIMPPSALCANYAAKIVGVEYKDILKKSPAAIAIILTICLLFLVFSSKLSFLTF